MSAGLKDILAIPPTNAWLLGGALSARHWRCPCAAGCCAHAILRYLEQVFYEG